MKNICELCGEERGEKPSKEPMRQPHWDAYRDACEPSWATCAAARLAEALKIIEAGR